MLVRLICLAILVLELRCLTLSIGDRRWKVLAFYTQLSNLAAALSALGVVVAGMTPATASAFRSRLQQRAWVYWT